MEGEIPLPKTEINQNYLLIYLRVSKCYICFHVFQIFLAFSLLFCLLAHLWGIIPFLEIIASFLLSMDLLIKYLSEGGKNFATSRNNFIDAAVLIMIVLIVVMDLFFPDSIHNSQGVVSLLVLGGRYLIQLWRVFVLSKQSKKQIEVNKLETIKLNISMEDEICDIQTP